MGNITTQLMRADELRLLEIGRTSIDYGLLAGRALEVDSHGFGMTLGEIAATFVTLKIDGRLRGCVGRLEATRALVADVAGNAYSAAFEDPRFSPLTPGEARLVAMHISILSPPVPLPCESEAELLERLEPGVHGVILHEGSRRGTFLPVMWQSLPEPSEFIRQLKIKTGLEPDYWSPTLRVECYTAYSFGEASPPRGAAPGRN